MGLFEHCMKMIDMHVIDWNTFKDIYGYRVSNILANPLVVEAKLRGERDSWRDFLRLVRGMGLTDPSTAGPTPRISASADGSNTKGWWSQTILNRTLPDKIAAKGVALSGFTFGAMVFSVGFFQADPSNSGPLVFSLLSSSAFFLASAELADMSLKRWEYFCAEALYVLAALLLFVGFSWFLWAKFSFFGWPPIAFFAAPAIIYVTIVIQSVLGIYRITKLRKDSGERARG